MVFSILSLTPTFCVATFALRALRAARDTATSAFFCARFCYEKNNRFALPSEFENRQ